MPGPSATGDLPVDIEAHIAIYAHENGLDDNSAEWLLDVHTRRFLETVEFLPSETSMEHRVRAYLAGAICGGI